MKISEKKRQQWIKLLEAIIDTGSINKASKELAITYKSAWKQLEQLKILFEEKPIVVTEIGGNKRGGTYLTNEGFKIFEELKRCVL